MDAQLENPKPRTVPSRKRDKERTVALLKRAARELLVSHGVAKLSIQPILNEAGVSRGALFHHFPTKNHLIAAAFTDLLETATSLLHGLSVDLRQGTITREQFVEGVRDAFCSSDLFAATVEIALNNRVDPNLRKLTSGPVESWWDSLSSFWTDTFDLPGRSTEDVEQHWGMASNLLRGHAFTSAYRSSPQLRASFCRSFESMMLADAVVRT